jgi:hypothetical protein
MRSRTLKTIHQGMLTSRLLQVCSSGTSRQEEGLRTQPERSRTQRYLFKQLWRFSFSPFMKHQLMEHQPFSHFCPKCSESSFVRKKLLLIDKLNEEHLKHQPDERSACSCQNDLSVDGLKPEFSQEAPLQQFVLGGFCDRCGVGFVPEEMAKPRPQLWKLSELGFHRVNPDGSLGPPQEIMK